MKNRFLKFQALSGALMMILVLIYGIIVGQSLDEKYIFLSLVVGLLAGWFIGFLRKRIKSCMKRSFKALKTSLNEGERIIVEGTAKHLKKEENVEGKLFLTDNRLIFSSLLPNYQIDIALDEIKGVYLQKKWGVFSKGFKISVDGREERFTVEYPGDWKKIIRKQQEVNRDPENAF